MKINPHIWVFIYGYVTSITILSGIRYGMNQLNNSPIIPQSYNDLLATILMGLFPLAFTYAPFYYIWVTNEIKKDEHLQ